MEKNKINNLNSYEVDIENLSPGMKQYINIRRKAKPDTILLYRMGDFYETFFEDAITISRDLDIVLTSRDAGKIGKVPLAGIPVKSVEVYVAKLLEKGRKVAICEQLEKPEEAKGIIKRDIVKTITAGTLTDDNLLVSNSNNYLASIWEDEKTGLFGFAYTDISTGEFKCTQTNLNQLTAELSRISPSEILALGIPQKLKPFQVVPEEKINLPNCITQFYNITSVPIEAYNIKNIEDNLELLFKIKNINTFDIENCKLGFIASSAIIYYILKMQMHNLPTFSTIVPYNLEDYVIIDANTRRNLEILETMREKKRQGSLLWAIDKTSTNMGGRLFKKWISQPLIDVENIKTRQNAVSEIISNSKARTKLAKLLSNTNDIERMGMRLANNTVNPRHFVGLKNSLMLIEDYQDVLKDLKSPLLNSFDGYEDLIDFAHILERTINDDPPSVLKDGNVIKPNVNAELDFFRDKLNNSDEFINNYEEKLKNELGIKLKVDYNRNAGYFIEVTTSFLNNIPPYFIRRQTLKGAERFITQELREHETAVVQASVRAIDLEIEIFNNLKEYSKEFISKILDLAQKISVIDVIVSLANVAIENNYSKPEIINGYEFEVVEGRHPVIEKMIPMGEYISNDFNLYKYGENTRFMVLTGPNMSGKSTYMRQNALIAIMAQMGGYVSAKYAKVGIFDKIFTRVGASDDLSVGQSTFMLEMTETAYILNAATQKSMILIDEIGRGTSTYDGVAIAYAVAWYISQNIKARTIFTTHYHELNVLANLYPEIKNFKVLVAENDGEVEFLRKVVEGQASKSYGIHVAKMAGLPDEVIKFANSVMTNMQKSYSSNLQTSKKILSQKTSNGQLKLNM